MKLDPETLTRFTAAICTRLGADQEIAEIVAGHLVRAESSGHSSHGVQRLPGYAALVRGGELHPAARPEVLRESAATALLDARRGFGQYSTLVALERAIQLAGRVGVGVVAVRHSHHIGRLGEYGERAAAAGMVAAVTVGMAGDGVGAMVLPGTSRRFFGANPWSFAFPTRAGHPVLVDVSTAVVAEGKLQLAAASGEAVPPGWIADATGQPTTDPADYFAGGGLLPLGSPTVGHKGYGLGLASALLGALALSGDDDPTMVGASVAEAADPRGRIAGVVVIAIDPAAFGSPAEYTATVTGTVAAIRRASPSAVVPGDPEATAREHAAQLELPEVTVDRLRQLAVSLDLSTEALDGH